MLKYVRAELHQIESNLKVDIGLLRINGKQIDGSGLAKKTAGTAGGGERSRWEESEEKDGWLGWLKYLCQKKKPAYPWVPRRKLQCSDRLWCGGRHFLIHPVQPQTSFKVLW